MPVDGQTPQTMGSYLPLIGYVVFFIAIFYFLAIRPQKKREKQQREMLAALKVGDKVTTIGGIIGKIQNIKDDVVTIEVGSDKTKIPFELSAIRNVNN